MNIVITGTSTGIGHHLCERLIDDGHIVFGCSRKPTTFSHKNYQHFELDVADEKAVLKMVSEVRANCSNIDVLINNAGIGNLNHLFTTPVNTVRNIFETNFIGTFLFCREVGKAMSGKKFGRIINLSSVASPLNLQGESIYAASKAAIENFSRTIAKELAPYGINVNCIGPGPIDTNLTKTISKEKLANVRSQQILNEDLNEDDIYNLVCFLISKASSKITGQFFYPGGV